MTLTAATPVTDGRPVPTAVPVRRPRMRRPAHEPEPVGCSHRVTGWPPTPVTVELPGPGPEPPVGTRPGGAGRAGPAETGDAGAPGDAAVPGGAAMPGGAAGRTRRQGAFPEPPAGEDPRRHATAVVRLMVEILAGRRPPAQLATHASPAVVRYLTASRSTGPGAPAVPERVHVSRPVPDAAEVVAVCRAGARHRALTVRMDRGPSARWCATQVRLL